MLALIKSNYIFQTIFSLTNEKIKFKLFKYSNSLQKKSELNLVDYRRFSGKYIIYYTARKGKEYDSFNDTLVYEGRFLKGERNGYGKEYGNLGSILFPEPKIIFFPFSILSI